MSEEIESHEASAEGARESPRGVRIAKRPLPLNSKRLTGAYVQAIARAMELPTKGSVTETRQMIEGKLGDDDRESTNVQVLIEEDGHGAEFVSLVDVNGVFLGPEPILYPREELSDGGGAETHGESEEDETEDRSDVVRLEGELAASNARNEELEAKVSSLSGELARVRERVNEIWKLNCSQMVAFDETITAKDAEIEQLTAKVNELEASLTRVTDVDPARLTRLPPLPHHTPISVLGSDRPVPLPAGVPMAPTPARRGKAPPVSQFSGEDLECQLDDWLPSLERASVWNAWTAEERLMQLAGHLKGRALQEYNLLRAEERESFESAVEALRGRLDPGSKAVAAQDFRHATQKDSESVADFVRRLERMFRIAYGRDPMSNETRDTLLYCQLQEGLRYELMRGPAVSGATKYQELCVAAKNEEKRLADLRRRQQYSKSSAQSRQTQSERAMANPDPPKRPPFGNRSGGGAEAKKCFLCKKPGHLMRDCKMKKSDSAAPGRPVATRQVTISGPSEKETEQPSPYDLLYSSDSEEGEDVRLIRVTDEGSQSQLARVIVQGVPADGVIDTGAGITIMGQDLFAKVAAAARLRKKNFRKPDKVPRTYDQKTFHLDGCMDMDLSFADKTMRTTVYIKMDAHDQLLLSEGVCRQLGIVSYHPSVCTGKATKKTTARVPTIRVNLIQSLRLPPNQGATISVKLEGDTHCVKHSLLVQNRESIEKETGLTVEDAIIPPPQSGVSQIVVHNRSGFTQCVPEGACLGEAEEAEVLLFPEPEGSDLELAETVTVKMTISGTDSWRKEKLLETIDLPELSLPDAELLKEFLTHHHNVFSLVDGERGETDLVYMKIETGEASPKKQPPRRMPFAVRQEVAKQLKNMQQNGVIQPSHSPWSSPVVMVRKKDGSHRFCVDYRGLNAVTKADTFPLPRIDDLLDQLGKAKYFSTLDLASGFWQIRIEPHSQEKTAFVTPQGLFEFRVMPFGLTNAPAVFQRLMQQVLAGLNPEDGKEFVTAYIDDILVFSPTLPEHIEHLQQVISRLKEVNLKLNPAKCKFVRKEVDYLGHVITAGGLKPNPRLTDAVQEFPCPENVHDLRRFLGMTSYYRRFIPNFAKLAQPLHQLTGKGVPFHWTAECDAAFLSLKVRLVTPPVLAYPCFGKDFTLETDASIQGLGAVLSQVQDDGKLHPVAYASRALNPSEKNYSVTELETLAVVWAVTHFHSYLYGNRVTVITDHSAVKAILETSNPTGKHARWWTRVYGRGVKEVHIVYRAGRENASADALSRHPHEPAPQQGIAQDETQVAAVHTEAETAMSELLQQSPVAREKEQEYSYGVEQLKDQRLKEIMDYLQSDAIPEDPHRARMLAAQESLFTLLDGVLYHVDARHGNRRRVAVPSHLREQLLSDSHRGIYSGHFSGNRLYNTLVKHWWWPGMYKDAVAFCKRCPECAVVTGAGRQHRPPLKPIPVQRPFQILGLDIMDLPCTEQGNKHVVVFQDMFTKWPLAFPVPDQKAERIAKLLCEEVVPLFGVPEALLTDRGANLLSHLMLDVCALLGIEKLNTTAYHPECDGMVERFNRTLKTMLRKRAAQFGAQWDKHLAAVLWAYRNTPHETTNEKPSFLLYGWDCRSPTEAAFVPPEDLTPTSVTDYREELMLNLSLARKSALENIRRSQGRYKAQYDKNTSNYQYRVGDWVLIRFPSDETGKQRKLSRPWHGPYRVITVNDTNLTAAKVYFPREDTIKVHRARAKPCPEGFMAGYYWYGNKRKGPGRPPKWVENALADTSDCSQESGEDRVQTQEEEGDDTPVNEPENEPEEEVSIDNQSTPGVDRALSHEDQVESQKATDSRKRSGRYSLRERVHPPARLQ